jgi:hypothetical protein
VNGELGGARWRGVADASGHGYADIAVGGLCLLAAGCTFAEGRAVAAEGCTALAAGMRAARGAGMCAVPVRASAGKPSGDVDSRWQWVVDGYGSGGDGQGAGSAVASAMGVNYGSPVAQAGVGAGGSSGGLGGALVKQENQDNVGTEYGGSGQRDADSGGALVEQGGGSGHGGDIDVKQEVFDEQEGGGALVKQENQENVNTEYGGSGQCDADSGGALVEQGGGSVHGGDIDVKQEVFDE